MSDELDENTDSRVEIDRIAIFHDHPPRSTFLWGSLAYSPSVRSDRATADGIIASKRFPASLRHAPSLPLATTRRGWSPVDAFHIRFCAI
jgi:hypothetical protein